MKESFEVKIFAMSDTHGALINQNYADNSKTPYGVSKLYTYISKHRTESSLLIDCGDTIQGSPLMYYHQLHRNESPNPVGLVYNHIGVDYFIPGNHDLNYGKDYLCNFIGNLKAKTLSANIIDSDKNSYFGVPYDIVTYENGIKIGIIGITTDYIPNWERKENIQGLTFLSPIESLKKYIQELKKEEVHAIIVAYHGGFERDLDTFEPYVQDTLENVGSRILEQFSEDIDVFLTGHQHRSINRMYKNTVIIQPAVNGKLLGEVHLHFEKNQDWKIINKDHSLVSSYEYPSDLGVEKLMEGLLEKTNLFLDEPIGYVPDNDLLVTDTFDARLKKHKIVTFINQVQLSATKAMISAASIGNEVTGFQQHISVRNVLSTYVYPNTLTVLKIDGFHLRQALEKNAEYFVLQDGKITFNPKYAYPKIEHYNYDMFDGISYTIDITKPYQSRIVSLKYGGKNVSDTDEFTLVLNNYRASGGGEFEMYQGLEIVKEFQLDVAELMTNYIREKKTIVIPNIKNIKIIT